jgi:hypothetical protein
MLKGIYKYPQEQSPTVRYWINHGKDEATDSLNYWYLLEEEFEKGEEHG